MDHNLMQLTPVHTFKLCFLRSRLLLPSHLGLAVAYDSSFYYFYQNVYVYAIFTERAALPFMPIFLLLITPVTDCR
jgi:hypothetical protein